MMFNVTVEFTFTSLAVWISFSFSIAWTFSATQKHDSLSGQTVMSVFSGACQYTNRLRHFLLFITDEILLILIFVTYMMKNLHQKRQLMIFHRIKEQSTAGNDKCLLSKPQFLNLLSDSVADLHQDQ